MTREKKKCSMLLAGAAVWVLKKGRCWNVVVIKTLFFYLIIICNVTFFLLLSKCIYVFIHSYFENRNLSNLGELCSGHHSWVVCLRTCLYKLGGMLSVQINIFACKLEILNKSGFSSFLQVVEECFLKIYF